MADVIDIKTRRPISPEGSLSRLESSLEEAFYTKEPAEVGRLAQLLQALKPKHPLALAGMAVHNLTIGAYSDAAKCADESVEKGHLGRVPVLAKLAVIHYGCDQGAYDFLDAMQFMEHALVQYASDMEVLDILVIVSTQTLSNIEFADRVMQKGMGAEPDRFRSLRLRI